jgi:hypothetical protein
MTATALRPGTRLRSQACSTEVVVVRAGTGAVDLTCAGHPMVGFDEPAAALPLVVGLDGGTAVGKRYTAASDRTIEVLVTKGGAGTLGDGATPLELKQAKPLPASD